MNQTRVVQGRWRRTAIAAAATMFMGSVAYAQSSEGSVYGQAAPGSQITILNVETGQTRQIQAESNGAFTFSKLAPGRYRVSSGGVSRDVNVAIGSGTAVSLEATTTIVVSGARTRTGIDTSSVESNSVFTQEQIQALPVARSVDAVALLAPGTVKGDKFTGAGNGDLTLPSFGGASIAENGYYINGLDVTNIRNFLSYAELPFDAIGQQQVKTGGYGAEYGRSLGGVVSLVTKRGTNEWKGGVGVYWEPSSMRSSGSDVADKDPDRAGLPYTFKSADTADNMSVVVYGGGPIIKDRLFVFASVEKRHDELHTYDQSLSTNRVDETPSGMLKVDWALTDNHLLEFTGIYNKKKYKYYDYDSVPDYATSHTGTAGVSEADSGGKVLIGKYTGYLTDDLTVSALVGQVNDKRLKYTGHRTLGADCPVVLDVNTAEIGCWIGPFPGVGADDPAAPRNEDVRKSYRLDLEYALGAHTLRAGIDNQLFTSSEAGGSSYTGGAYYRYFVVGANGAINGVNGFTPGSQYVRKRILQTTTGEYEVENSALYLEDSWKVNKNLLLYGGLRWESFDNMNGAGESFVKQDNLLAPRLGMAWDIAGDSTTKLFANYGRYYIPVASNTNIRATRGELFEHTYYQFASRDPRTAGPVGMGPSIGTPQVTSDGSLPNPGTVSDTKLDPMNQDEYILGFQKAVSKDFIVGIKGTHRKVNSGMDDFCNHTAVADWITANVSATYEDNLATCMLMNPGKDLNIKVDLAGDGNLSPVTIPAAALGLAKYERKYSSVELTFERPFDGKWSLAGSYTWSKSEGTAEGYVQSNLDQADAGVTQDFDFASFTHGAYGYLPNDRRHVFKLYGNYQVTEDWRLGMNGTVASGRPSSCVGFVPPTVADFSGSSAYTTASSYYCIKDPSQPAQVVNRGTEVRTPWSSTFDLSVAYIPTWAQKKLTLQVDVFNLFNSQKATELNEVRDYSRAESNATTFPLRQNLNYQSPTSFQDPRYVRLTARYEF